MKWKSLRTDGTRRDFCVLHFERKIDTVDKRVTNKGRVTQASYVLREEISAKFSAFINSTELLDLTKELILFRSYLSQGLEHWQELEDKFTFSEADWVFNRVERLSKLIETIVRIRNDTALTVAEVHYIQVAVATILKKYVPTERLREAVEEIFKLTATAEHTEVDPYYDKVVDGEVVEGDCTLGEFEYVLNSHGVLGKK